MNQLDRNLFIPITRVHDRKSVKPEVEEVRMGKMRREERSVCTFSPTLCSLRLQSQTLPQLPNPDTHQRASEK